MHTLWYVVCGTTTLGPYRTRQRAYASLIRAGWEWDERAHIRKEIS